MKNLFITHEFKILLSIIWGLGISCLFRQVCKGRNCIIFKAPDPAEIKNNIYKEDDTCYKFKTENTKCTNDVISS
jgi:hypothetical protein